MEITARHHLRNDEVRDLVAAVEDALSVTVEGEAFELVELDDPTFDLVVVDGDPLACYVEGTPFLTVRGANAFPPERRVVTVDAGAVSFVSDGADVMRPGIVEADPAIAPDDLVVVDEETHGKALAVGRALVAGEDMTGESGKVVESVHHVGDELYEFTV